MEEIPSTPQIWLAGYCPAGEESPSCRTGQSSCCPLQSGDTYRRRDMRHCTNAACVPVPDDAADPSPMTATNSNDTDP
jgi:hypothetical protein